MNNFRTPKNIRSQRTSIDGFVGGKPSLGDFKRPDGFHSTPGQRPIGFGKPTATSGVGSVGLNDLRRRPVRDENGSIKLGATPHSKSKGKIRHNWVKVVKRSAIALSVLVLVGGGYMGVNGYLKARKILSGGGGAAALQENVNPSKLRGEGDGRVNILLLGKGGPGHTAPDLTDTILIASIDPIHKEAALLSIPRDLYVKTALGSMKINAAYASAKNKVLSGKKIDDQANKAEEAGMNAVEDAIEASIGIPIHYHGMIDFKGFQQAIDAVGGVDVNVTKSLYEVMRIDGRSYTLNVKPGKQHFDGFRALAYARSRLTSTRGDFDRGERQRLILLGLKDKIFSLGTLSNPIKINELVNAFGDHVSTNMTMEELLRLYDIGKQIDSSKVESIGLADPPNDYVITGNVSGQSIVMPRAGVRNFKEIHNFVRNKLRDGFLRQEDAKIAVYNGTNTSGLAARTSDDLKSYGYTITATADAPVKGNSTTILVDLTGGKKKYTKHYLEQRLKVTATSKLPEGITISSTEADFAIILGTDEVTRLEN